MTHPLTPIAKEVLEQTTNYRLLETLLDDRPFIPLTTTDIHVHVQTNEEFNTTMLIFKYSNLILKRPIEKIHTSSWNYLRERTILEYKNRSIYLSDKCVYLGYKRSFETYEEFLKNNNITSTHIDTLETH